MRRLRGRMGATIRLGGMLETEGCCREGLGMISCFTNHSKV